MKARTCRQKDVAGTYLAEEQNEQDQFLHNFPPPLPLRGRGEIICGFSRAWGFKMDKEIKDELRRVALRHRPRPLMGPFYDHKTGKKYYIRKRDLSYFQLREKYPKHAIEALSPMHIFQKSHHLSKSLDEIELEEKILPWCFIGIAAAIAIFYTVIFITAIL